MSIFDGESVIIDASILDDFARLAGTNQFHVARRYCARVCTQPHMCDMEWRPQVFGFRCSVCGRITRAMEGSIMNYCPYCGAENREQRH